MVHRSQRQLNDRRTLEEAPCASWGLEVADIECAGASNACKSSQLLKSEEYDLLDSSLMVFLFHPERHGVGCLNLHKPPTHSHIDIPQAFLVRYIRSAYSFFGINSNDENPNISYSTRVELVEKRFDAHGNEQGWRLTLKEFIRLGPSSSKERWWTEV